MKKELLSPRGYLSWTQVDMWERSRERYVRSYIHGENLDFTNSGMEYGSKTSRALENGDAEGDELMEAVISLVPAYKEREYEIKVPLETDHGTTTLLGKLDTFDPPTLAFREYKTGRTKWTIAKAQKHGQMKHYGTLIYLKYGKLPTDAQLDWIQTQEVDGVVSFTGHIEPFHVELGMVEILEYMARVSRVAVEIDARYREELKNLT